MKSATMNAGAVRAPSSRRSRQWSAWAGDVALGVVFALLATGVRGLLDPWLGDKFPVSTCFYAVLAAAWWRGVLAGLSAAATGATLSTYFWMEPRQALHIRNVDDQIGLGLFLIASVVISLIGGVRVRFARRMRTALEESQRNEKALRAKETELQSIADTTPLILTRCSRDLRYLFGNRAAAAFFGTTPDEMTGKPIADMIGKDALAFIMPHIERVLHGERVEFEAEIPYAAGARWVRVVYVPERDADGRVEGWLASIDDITGLKRIEHALRESEARLAGMINSAMDAVIAIDSAQRIVLFNPAAEQMFGCSKTNAIGNAIDRFIPLRYREGHRKHVDNFGKTGSTNRRMGSLGALSGVRANGEEFPIEASISHLEIGSHKLFTVILRDVTERKRAEETLRQARDELIRVNASLDKAVQERTARLEEMVRELQHVSYAIAHDMRAPLRAMGAFAEILIEEAAQHGTSPTALDYCQRIVTAANRLDILIRDALNYSKAVLQQPTLEPVDLATLMRGLVETYPNLHVDKVDIVIENQLPVVLGNESLLTQCFSNLLGNAVKFVAPGTRPMVRVRASEPANGVARVWIEDNGIGIPEHARPRLFGMFQKLDNRYEGTGIGLAIVRKVVERMEGKVGVESEPDHGSRFWVELRTTRVEQVN